jgi:hypothetical protein
VIEVARQHGWKAKDTVKEWTAFVVVHIERPSGSVFISDKKSIYIWKPKADVDAPPGGSFIILSREVIGKFPAELIEPLKERVRVHLAGRPLTTKEKKEAATQVPKPPGQILVTAGSLAHPHETLGEVRHSTAGALYMSSISDALFRSPLSVAAAGATPDLSREGMNNQPRQTARKKYGNRVDPIVNVTYDTRPDGNTFGSGLAVRFLAPDMDKPQQKTVKERLQELQSIYDQGLINDAEFDAKRKDLLDSL